MVENKFRHFFVVFFFFFLFFIFFYFFLFIVLTLYDIIWKLLVLILVDMDRGDQDLYIGIKYSIIGILS